MSVHEPMTLLTDYLLAILVGGFALGLARQGRRSGQISIKLWSVGFFASAVAAAAGGTYHGFAPVLPPLVGGLLWKLTVNAVGAASFCLPAGVVNAVSSGAVRRWLIGVLLVKLLVYATWMVAHDDFRFVIYDYAPALLLVLLLQAPALFRRQKSAQWIAAGILVSFAAAGVQMSGFSPHRHFNHNDLYHVVQMGAFYCLYRGGRLLRDR